MAETTVASPAIPEQGRLAHLRHRFWLVQDVTGYQPAADGLFTHRVTLECVDDDHLGEPLDVIWEREVVPRTYESRGLPEPV